MMNEVRDCKEHYHHFLGSVGSITSYNEWTVQLGIGSIPVTFKIYTGADVLIMTAKTVLNCPSGRLNCIGQFAAHTDFKNNRYSSKVFVKRLLTTYLANQ